MKIKNASATRHSHERWVVTAEITDAKPRSYRWGSNNQYDPTSITITWERFRDGDEPWSEWESFHRATISGPKLTEGGEPWPSGAQAYESFISESDPTFGAWVAGTRPLDEWVTAAESAPAPSRPSGGTVTPGNGPAAV